MIHVLDGHQTARLSFRLLKEEDFDLWLPLFEEAEAARFLGMDPTKPARELCQLWFDKIFHRYENDLGGMNVLIDTKTNQLVGQCGLLVQTVEEEQRLEVGYSILPAYWGKGYASEASQKCKHHAFTEGLTDSLISIVHIDNIGSARVAQKNGMTIEKTLEDYKGMPVNIYAVSRLG